MDYNDYLKKYCPGKAVSAEKAVSKIKKGSRVFIGTGCGEPQHLIRAMVADKNLYDIQIYQMLSDTLAGYIDDPFFLQRFSIKLFFISYAMRKAAFEGKLDYMPAYLSQIPKLFSSKRIGLDVALVQLSPPDAFGYCSLGVSVDITRSGLENAGLVIAQINPYMPRTLGDTFVHLDQVDYVVVHSEPLIENHLSAPDDNIACRIGHYVSQLVEDGSTLQIGFGRLPSSLMRHLEGKKDLGIHTQVITDGFLSLFKKKIITNKKKTLLPGRVVASLCMGSQETYDFLDNNPLFYFRDSAFVNDPTVIARNDNLISLCSALEVDLTGQVCMDSTGYRFYSGIGDQVDFIRGSAMSDGGFSIVALPSTAQNGEVSRIVSHLSEGAGVATTRGDVNFVVTEYGIAELQGKSIYQRSIELAQIAHPKFREALIDEAKAHHYIFADQLPPNAEDLLFIEAYKSTIQMKNGKEMELRPLLPSDELAYRNFFYSLQDDTIYSRFFHYRRIFSHEKIQKEVANVDYRRNMTLVGFVSKRGRKEIMSICSYAESEDNRAEVAFVVREDYQGLGVGTQLLDMLERIAKKNGYRGFTASVLKQNVGMIRVFTRKYPNAKKSWVEADVSLVMDFDELPETDGDESPGGGDSPIVCSDATE
ncbi:MAG: GNAT family N-acetyltransferase [Syntrophobacteraceae bacterium]